MEFYNIIKKNGIITLDGKWMELEIMLSETARLRKSGFKVLSHMWNLERKGGMNWECHVVKIEGSSVE